jgi:ribosome biogenesis GTPase / thiamine phosphate phosphatase
MLDTYGWSAALQHAFPTHVNDTSCIPARVIACHRDLWRVVTGKGERNARLTGRFARHAQDGGYPVVGDWIAAHEIDDDDATIHAVLPRTGVFRRRMAGGEGAQIIAANVDVAFLVAGLNRDLNPRRMERYLVAARDAGATPVILLTKADLAADVTAESDRIVRIAGDAPVIALSALFGQGLEALAPFITPGATCVLLGSSGAGKSTLLNALAGDAIMRTAAARADDDRGRHTTTHRELFRLPSGALVIDTPGMRELGLVAEDDALDASFTDVSDLAAQCRFSNCRHGGEPGCAIAEALDSGALDPSRWAAFGKLQKELAYAARREDPELEAAERKKWKQIHKNQKARYRAREEDE